MTKESITCRKCGEGGLKWAQTKAGKWYLTPAEGKKVYGDGDRHIKTLALAHRCKTEQEREEQQRNDARDLRYQELRELPEYKGWDGHDKAIATIHAEMGPWE